MKKELNLTFSEEELNKVEHICQCLDKDTGEVISSLLKHWLTYFQAVDDNLEYFAEVSADGRVVSIDDEKSFSKILAYDLAGANEYDEEEMLKRAYGILENVPENGDIIPYPGSKKWFIRKASVKEVYENAWNDNYDNELTSRLANFLLNGGCSGMESRLRNAAEKLKETEIEEIDV